MPATSAGRKRLFSAVVFAAVIAIAANVLVPAAHGGGEDGKTPWTHTPSSGRPFATTSAFNVEIPKSVDVEANSAAIVSYLSGHPTGNIANLYEFGMPIFHANAGDPLVAVDCTENWGHCKLEDQQIRMPAAAAANSGSDGKITIIDWQRRESYEFWQARKINATTWTASWGGVESIDDDGREVEATGSELSQLAGVIRTHEVEKGVIPHALVFATDRACKTYRWPATKSDGWSAHADCLPHGTRVQLDPTLNVDAIPGISKAEKAVAKALQTYGAYSADNGGARMSFTFEKPTTGSDPYPAAGLAWDYYQMGKIPWDKLRVLSHAHVGEPADNQPLGPPIQPLDPPAAPSVPAPSGVAPDLGGEVEDVAKSSALAEVRSSVTGVSEAGSDSATARPEARAGDGSAKRSVRPSRGPLLTLPQLLALVLTVAAFVLP